MSSAPQVTEVPRKPLQGKYDGRRNNGKRGRVPDSGRKPLWARNLGRNTAHKVLVEFDAIIEPAQIYKRALDANLLSLCWEMRCAVENRLLGRPFVALNPAETPQSASIQQDNRLQLAIGTLVLPGVKVKGKKRAKIVDAQVIDTPQLSSAVPDVPESDPSSREPHPHA